MLDLNLRSAFLTCRAVARHLVERGTPESIINLASVAAQTTPIAYVPKLSPSPQVKLWLDVGRSDTTARFTVEDVALVDGNVARVLCRVFALDGDPRLQALQKAQELLPPGRDPCCAAR